MTKFSLAEMKVSRLLSLSYIYLRASQCNQSRRIRWRNCSKAMHSEMTVACIQSLHEITRENAEVRWKTRG